MNLEHVGSGEIFFAVCFNVRLSSRQSLTDICKNTRLPTSNMKHCTSEVQACGSETECCGFEVGEGTSKMK